MNNFHFQYCQKLVVLSKNKKTVLLCKRKGEADYDGVFSFIGGKMETTDTSMLEGLEREKNEEVGKEFKANVFTKFSHNLLFAKKDGNSMILPHYLAIYVQGDIVLSNEYSEHQWVPIDTLDQFEPKIPNIPEVVKELLRLEKISSPDDFVLI